MSPTDHHASRKGYDEAMTERHALDHRIPPPIVAVVIAITMGLIARFTAPDVFPSSVRVIAGGGLLILAGVIGGGAFAAFRRARTTINPVNLEAASSLVTHGVYRWSRNPMYVALASLLSALAIVLGSGWALLGPPLFVGFITRFQIVPEERVMFAKFGEAYRHYQASVRRWL